MSTRRGRKPAPPIVTVEPVDFTAEITAILLAHGYPGRFAAVLAGEGMGPDEVTERCKVARNAVGSLGYTHGISSNYEAA